tara:strand:+ start:6275 stop:6694 length:420 start_codon:yes stop_codon:yes gene_type:complete
MLNEELIDSNNHCGSKPKKIAFGIAPLGIISIGIVPMGVVSIGLVPMGVISFGAVGMGIINASLVGMGLISAGITTMGLIEYGPLSLEGHSHHKKFEDKGEIKNNLFKTKSEAERQAILQGCKGAHRMGTQWMPCSYHK